MGNDKQTTKNDHRALWERARNKRQIRLSEINEAGVPPVVACDCGSEPGEYCPTPSGWHYARRDKLVSLWRQGATTGLSFSTQSDTSERD